MHNTTGDARKDGEYIFPNLPQELKTHPKLTKSDRAVCDQLYFWWKSTGVAYPKQKELADELHVREETVRRALRKLEAMGQIPKAERCFVPGKGTVNKYDFADFGRRPTGHFEDSTADQPDISTGHSTPDQPDISGRPTPHFEDQPHKMWGSTPQNVGFQDSLSDSLSEGNDEAGSGGNPLQGDQPDIPGRVTGHSPETNRTFTPPSTTHPPCTVEAQAPSPRAPTAATQQSSGSPPSQDSGGRARKIPAARVFKTRAAPKPPEASMIADRIVPYAIQPCTDEIRDMLRRGYDALTHREQLALERWLNSQPWPEKPAWKYNWTTWDTKHCFRCGGLFGPDGTNRAGDGDYGYLCCNCWREKARIMREAFTCAA
jgi:hypothetical protein